MCLEVYLFELDILNFVTLKKCVGHSCTQNSLGNKKAKNKDHIEIGKVR